MEATKARESGASTLDCHTNEGTVKTFSKTITVKTHERTDLAKGLVPIHRNVFIGLRVPPQRTGQTSELF